MLRRIAPGEVRTPILRRRHGFERTALLAPVEVVGDRHRVIAVVQKGDQALGILVRQRA